MEYPVPNTTTKLKKPLSKSVVRHNTDMLAAIAKANAEGKTQLVRHLIGRHLKSYDAKLVAAKEAFRKMGRPAPNSLLKKVFRGGRRATLIQEPSLKRMKDSRRGHF